VGRDVQRHLDVRERVVEVVGRDQLVGPRQGPRGAQRPLGRGQAVGREEVEVRADRPRRGRCIGDEPVDLGVGGPQQGVVDDAGDHHEPVGGEPAPLLVAQHRRAGVTASPGSPTAAWGPGRRASRAQPPVRLTRLPR